jgi:long-subunit fatty acid transport protein
LTAFDFEFRNYSQVLERLKIKLSHGNGSDQVLTVPLDWDDLFAFAFGIEYRLTDRFYLRTGYHYDSEIVPKANLLPIIPTVGETHMISFGVGYWWNKFRVDGGWAYHFLNGERTRITAFPNAPEYNNSKVEYGCNYFVITISFFL